jgi:uncharacterized membrane protein
MSTEAQMSSDQSHRSSTVTIWIYLGALLAGLILGMVGAFLQATSYEIGPVTVPVWAILLLASLATSIRAITIAYGSRKPALAFFLGWLIASAVLSLPLPSGDQVIADGGLQVFYFFGGVVLGSAFVSLPAVLGGRGPTKAETNAAIRGGPVA